MAEPVETGKRLALEARGLYKSYDELVAVDGIDVEIRHGECVGLLGPNGAGKSTTMKLCLGLAPIEKGEVRLLGRPLPAQMLEARQLVGVVPQDDWLDPDFTVIENMEVYAGYYRIPREVAAKRIASLLETVQLSDRKNEKIGNLSGGLRRRLSLARALVNDPQLVFLDEPTTGLDPQARHQYWEQLRLLKDRKTSLFLTTHYMEEAERLCDRVCVVDHGQVIASGAPRRLVYDNVEKEVAEIHGEGAAEWVAAQGVDCRVARLGMGVYCYADDLSQLAAAAAHDRRLSCITRPTNLEDVYMKLTGHLLRE